MRLRTRTTPRRGAVLPLVAICTIAMIGMVALAIDIGMVAVARTQCQNAADSAAMAGARMINGNSTGNYGYSSVPGEAITAAVANKVFSTYVQGDPTKITNVAPVDSQGNYYIFQSGQVTVKVGTYAYSYNDANPSLEGFAVQVPRSDTTEPYSAVNATVTATGNFSFGKIFGLNTFNASATATAVHRPRDVMIIMDLSGSMRFQSLPGVPMSGGQAAASASNLPRTQSMNPESVFPQFGQYSNIAAAALQGTNSIPTTTGEYVDPCNISSTQNSGPPICADFYGNAVGVAPGPSNVAFTRAPDSYSTAPGGDNFLKMSQDTGANYATNVNDVVGSTSYNAKFETGATTSTTGGYDAYRGAGAFNGYTQGPGYWGKTFRIWPPDPRGSSADPSVAANYANNGAKDWRQRFFFKVNTTTGQLGWLDHNSILFNSSGGINNPATSTTVSEFGANNTYTYRINYAAILTWLNSQSPTMFPSTLQAGRIRFYSALPDPTDTTLNNRWWTTATLASNDERFWKDYIDFVLGLRGTGAGTYSTTNASGTALSSLIGNGDYFTWGTTQISAKPSPALQVSTTINHSGGYAAGATGALTVATMSPVPSVGARVMIGNDSTIYTVTAPAPTATTLTLNTGLKVAAANSASVRVVASATTSNYMDYKDNPLRARHQFWFGPMTFVDWLGNYNTPQFWWPGNVHEAHAWACKVGIQTAIDDIQKNHPNDFIGLTFFSSPKSSAAGAGHHNQAVVPLGRSYQQLKDSLWFPPTTVTGGVSEIGPYDADMDNVPRANGGTSPQMGFMIAYNQFSSSATNLRFYSQPSYQLPSNKVPNYRGQAGGLGRKGANRLVIFETDGVPNSRAYATLAGSGADSYYPIRIGNPQNLSDASNNKEWPTTTGSFSLPEIYAVVQQIVALNTASPPGFSTQRKPALVFCIGYGGDFDPANAGTNQTNALTFLQTVMFNGNTAADTTPANFPTWLRIYGTNTNRINTMQQAFTNIMQSGVQVSLIQ